MAFMYFMMRRGITFDQDQTKEKAAEVYSKRRLSMAEAVENNSKYRADMKKLQKRSQELHLANVRGFDQLATSKGKRPKSINPRPATTEN
eukprot:gene25534-11270_t